MRSFTTRADAIASAVGELDGTPGDHELRVYTDDGRLDYAEQRSGTEVSTWSKIKDEKETADKAVDFALGQAWPVLVILLGPALNGLIAPEVAEQRTFWGVFLATLAWSLGVAGAFLVLHTAYEQNAWNLNVAVVVVLCLAGGSAAATGIGIGAYDAAPNTAGDNVLVAILEYATAAVLTFGPLGAVLGLVCGAVAGWWGLRLWQSIS